MDIVRSILLALAALLLGRYLGKNAIDSLVDTNIKGFFNRLKALGGCLLISIAFAIFDSVMRTGWIISAILCLGGFLFGFFYYMFCNTTVGLKTRWDDTVGTVVPDQVFDSARPETGYDLYLPAEKSKDGTYALVLYIHGGGFTSGDKKDGAVWCKYMTKKGYVSASMNYTLQSKEHRSNLHLMAGQALECVRAIQLKCQELGYPVTEMAVSGGSAGSAIAMLFAYGMGNESPIPIKFVFQQTGPASFDPLMWGKSNHDYQEQADFISAFSGATITADMVKNGEHYDYIAAMSPADLVDHNPVPTLSAYGPRDQMVPVQLKFLLFRALDRNHVPYDYVEYPHSNHGLYDDPKAQLKFLKMVDTYCDRFFVHQRK